MKRLLGGQPSVVIFKHSHAKHTSIDFQAISEHVVGLHEINLIYMTFLQMLLQYLVYLRSKHLRHSEINGMLANVVINNEIENVQFKSFAYCKQFIAGKAKHRIVHHLCCFVHLIAYELQNTV